MAEPAGPMKESPFQRPVMDAEFGIRVQIPRFETPRAVERLGAPEKIKDFIAAGLSVADLSEEKLFNYKPGTGREAMKATMMDQIRSIAALKKDIPIELRDRVKMSQSFCISYLYRLQQRNEERRIKPIDALPEPQQKAQDELNNRILTNMNLDPINTNLQVIDPALATLDPNIKVFIAHAIELATMPNNELFANMNPSQFKELLFRLDGIRASREGMTMQYQEEHRGLMIQLMKDLLSRRFAGTPFLQQAA